METKTRFQDMFIEEVHQFQIDNDKNSHALKVGSGVTTLTTLLEQEKY